MSGNEIIVCLMYVIGFIHALAVLTIIWMVYTILCAAKEDKKIKEFKKEYFSQYTPRGKEEEK